MKDETDRFVKDLEKELNAYQLFENDIIHRIGNHEIPIPRHILKSLELRCKFYLTEDIGDIIANYDKLSTTRHIPFSICFWALKTFLPLFIKDKQMRSGSSEDINLYLDLTCQAKSGWHPKFNFNIATIDDIYLTNFDFIKKDYFKATEFDVTDSKDDTIRGVFVYEHNPPVGSDDISQAQLKNVLSVDEKTTFHLVYVTMDERYRIKLDGTHKYRGKKIYVCDIQRAGLDYEESPFISSDSFIPTTKSPILSSLW